MNLLTIQTALQQENIDCWVVYDFQNNNPVLTSLFPTGEIMLTRRVFFIIPAQGEPQIVGSKIDADSLERFSLPITFYVSWQELHQRLTELLAPYHTIALDYSPMNELPTISRVDAGTVEFIRHLGKTVVSSANVFQSAAARWGEGVLEAHQEDCQRVATIKDEAFSLIADHLRRSKPINEYDVQSFIMNRFDEEGLYTNHAPIVGINAHSGDPHYVPTAEKAWPIKHGDWILIDLWAKRQGYQYVFCDITWVGVAAAQPTPKQQTVFEAVVGARDAAVAYIQQQYDKGLPVAGWQVDDVTRDYITQAGYGDYFFHRTGHSLGPGNITHGVGANIDNLETHDTRTLSPGIGFSIEPGIYLPEFGIRSEIDVYMQESGPLVTTSVQTEVICLGS